MSMIAGDIGSKSTFPDGIQVDHISENTVGHGVRVRGISDPTTYPVIAGDVGEVIEAAGSSTATSTVNLTSVTLGAGEWDLTAICNGNMTGSGASDCIDFAISTANNNLTGAFSVSGITDGVSKGMFTTGVGNRGMGSLVVQVKITASTTYYLNALKPSAGTATGRLFARRRA